MLATLSFRVLLNPLPLMVSIVPPPVPPLGGVTEVISEVMSVL